MRVGEKLCDSYTCKRPGCSPEAGCQGHVMRERAPVDILAKAQELVAYAERMGVVLTVEQVPLQPLAMGNYRTEVSVRPARDRS